MNQQPLDWQALSQLFRQADSMHALMEASSPLDACLRLLSAAPGPVTFVQVGANDGVLSDPLRPFIAAGDWQGIFVEPHPEPFAKLGELYGGDPTKTLVNAAIAAEDGPVTLFVPDTRFGVLVATLEPNAGWSAKSDGETVELTVDGYRLSTLLAERGIEDFDVLQIDTEGYDFDVLCTVDFQRTRPLLINYEDRHLFPPKKRRKAIDFLRDHGYHVIPGLPPRDALAVDLDRFARRLSGDAAP